MIKFLTISTVIAMAAAPAIAGPAPELVAMGKSMAGTWSCNGQGLGRDGKLTGMTATTTWTIEMDGWWLRERFSAKIGNEIGHAYDGYISLDPRSKKWRRVMVVGGGGWNSGETTSVTACGAAPNGCRMDWELSAHNMMGEFVFRDHVDATDLKHGLKGWGELSMDNGKTWTKAGSLAYGRTAPSRLRRTTIRGGERRSGWTSDVPGAHNLHVVTRRLR
jgi:hypothetical protein